MPKYNVLAEVTQFFEIEADNAKDAEMKAFKSWQTGDLAIDETAIFVCEECDLIEEEENEL
jgi:hypothetical protein